VRMVSPAPPFEQIPEPLTEGDGRQALVTTRPVYFDGTFTDTRIYSRDRLSPGDTFAGPAIISEYTSATVLPPGGVVRVDALRNLVIEVNA
jgi:N-methylhydantoinase A